MALRVQVKTDYPDYHAAPVAAFGDQQARLLIVGLAPGLHGANASGRPFTGDAAGVLLYQTLYDFGFSSQPRSGHRHDGLELTGCRITNAVKCLPPKNKPTGAEIRNCNRYLANEIGQLPRPLIMLALGRIAHDAVLTSLGIRKTAHGFAHAAIHALDARYTLIDSYHCSRYNINTGRLTAAMFRDVFKRIRKLVDCTA